MRRFILAVLAVTLFSPIPAFGVEECAPGLTHVPPLCVAPDNLAVSVASQTRTVNPGAFWGVGVERWRPWVQIYFQPWDVDRALRIMRCESLGDPWAKNRLSGAAGLFQHMPRYWPERSARFGWAGWSVWSPDANIAIAAALVYHDSMSWRHWVCRG